MHPVHAERLCDLHRQLNMGHDVQREIDSYLFTCCVQIVPSQNMLLRNNWMSMLENFRISPDRTFSVFDCVDFGLYVRQCITNHTIQGSKAFQRVVSYSIPFVKHNRLTFPTITELSKQNMIDMLKIMLASCLGLIPGASRKPIFRNRVIIFKIVLTLLTEGTLLDMHTFLCKSMHLVRVAVMEYFIFFTTQFMPLEMSFLMQTHTLNLDCNVLRNVQMCIDNFRQTSLQCDVFKWDFILDNAQQCNDKCNRICKGKQKALPATTSTSSSTQMSLQSIRTALQYPLYKSPHIMKFVYPHLKMEEILQIIQVQTCIEIYNMPVNFVEMQKQHLKQMVRTNTISALESTYLCLCLHCINYNNVGDTNMRVDASQNLQCNRCMDNSAVVRINMIGRYIKINNHYFTYCVYCKRTHKCDDKASHMFGCSEVKKPEQFPPKKECFVCKKTLNLTSLQVVDEKMGCMHAINLCRRHTPWSHRQRYIYTLKQLAYDVKHKYSLLSPFKKN